VTGSTLMEGELFTNPKKKKMSLTYIVAMI
jgi:hypothetical protein